ncbi:MAG: hypothetical protein GXP22_00380 [Gammaproteobacteria bacterium]|nr:hypothetical protein [Gammaproteobacteria bacterium]
MRGWENHRVKITRPAERLLRMIYHKYVTGHSSIRDLIGRLGQSNRDIYVDGMRLEETANGWAAAA